MPNRLLTFRIPSELFQQLRTQLTLENSLTEDSWIGRPLTLTDLVREALKRGLNDRLRELRAKADVGSTVMAKLP